METLIPLFGLAIVNRAIIDYLSKPVKQKFPELDMWWLVYVSFVTGFIISMVSGFNAFAEYVPNELLGTILTAAGVGGGSNLLQDFVGAFRGPSYSAWEDLIIEDDLEPK